MTDSPINNPFENEPLNFSPNDGSLGTKVPRTKVPKTKVPKTKVPGANVPGHSPVRIRFIIFVVIFGAAAAAVLFRYGYLMVNPAEPEWVRARRTERGAILDRNDRPLALQTRLGNVTVWKPNVADPEALGRELAPILEMGAAEIRERIESSPSDFLYLKKQIDQSMIGQIEDARKAGVLPGVGIESIVGRIYPDKRRAGQIIGFVGDENNGLAGIEYAFESDLAGGSQVVLTIDAKVQYILENIARRVYTENRAEAVMLTAMNPRTGEILGAASLPDFDPNDIRSSDAQSRMDRPAILAYEPGSVFKVFSIAALLDSGAIGEQTVFNCNGHYERVTGRGERVLINCLGAHGPVTARDIIIKSCNAGSAYAADRLEAIAFYNRLRDFGFGSRTGAGNPGEHAGSLSLPDRWSDRSKPTIAMGQEISVTTLQMLQAASAIANDGVLVSPRIVSRIVSGNGKTARNYETPPPRRVLKAETARAMRSYMVDVTSDIGTAWRARVEDLSLAVKTGTAEMTDPSTGAYSKTDYIASCIALLPADSPSLVLYVAIVKPKGEYLGGRIAAPPIREAAEALVDYLGIPRGLNPQVLHSGEVSLPNADIPQIGTVMPNFAGYSKRQLWPLLLWDDLNITINGDGHVVRQYPAPGTALEENTVIVLELE
ncbi:penicillin-binding protein [Spirochaetia bacterium]|nr:penicillin-binding protein [Spirochaetia bacterium]